MPTQYISIQSSILDEISPRIMFNLSYSLNFLISVLQFPIECSLPWMLMDHVIESQNVGLLESVLMPFDIYNDAAHQALVVLKQRFLYDEIEAEVHGIWK